MVTLENWLAFTLASLILLAVPGPTVLTVIGHSFVNGKNAGRPLVAAVFLGDSTSAALSLAGLGLLLQNSDHWLRLLQAGGGIYLMYLGFGFLRAPVPDSTLAMQPASKARWNIFGSTYLVSALNPKGFFFFTAFLPLFVESAKPPFPQLCILAATFVALATLSTAVYAQLACTAAMMDRSSGILVIARRGAGASLVLAGMLALSDF